MKKTKKYLAALVTLIIISLFLSSCGNSKAAEAYKDKISQLTEDMYKGAVAAEEATGYVIDYWSNNKASAQQIYSFTISSYDYLQAMTVAINNGNLCLEATINDLKNSPPKGCEQISEDFSELTDKYIEMIDIAQASNEFSSVVDYSEAVIDKEEAFYSAWNEFKDYLDS